MSMKKTPLVCDWKTGSPLKGGMPSAENKSRLCRFRNNFRWQGIKVERYKPAGIDWAGIVRQTLIGNRGETPKFHLRYFEIAPGGRSSLERHRHEHVVICVRGRGSVILAKKAYRIGFLDTVYISPNTPHQLKNPFKEPFGFFCIVNAKRDKPRVSI